MVLVSTAVYIAVSGVFIWYQLACKLSSVRNIQCLSNNIGSNFVDVISSLTDLTALDQGMKQHRESRFLSGFSFLWDMPQRVTPDSSSHLNFVSSDRHGKLPSPDAVSPTTSHGLPENSSVEDRYRFSIEETPLPKIAPALNIYFCFAHSLYSQTDLEQGLQIIGSLDKSWEGPLTMREFL